MLKRSWKGIRKESRRNYVRISYRRMKMEKKKNKTSQERARQGTAARKKTGSELQLRGKQVSGKTVILKRARLDEEHIPTGAAGFLTKKSGRHIGVNVAKEWLRALRTTACWEWGGEHFKELEKNNYQQLPSGESQGG